MPEQWIIYHGPKMLDFPPAMIWKEQIKQAGKDDLGHKVKDPWITPDLGSGVPVYDEDVTEALKDPDKYFWNCHYWGTAMISEAEEDLTPFEQFGEDVIGAGEKVTEEAGKALDELKEWTSDVGEWFYEEVLVYTPVDEFVDLCKEPGWTAFVQIGYAILLGPVDEFAPDEVKSEIVAGVVATAYLYSTGDIKGSIQMFAAVDGGLEALEAKDWKGAITHFKDAANQLGVDFKGSPKFDLDPDVEDTLKGLKKDMEDASAEAEETLGAMQQEAAAAGHDIYSGAQELWDDMKVAGLGSKHAKHGPKENGEANKDHLTEIAAAAAVFTLL